ncbi:IS3 family transposase [Chloroflexota bacterium]
MHAIVLLVLTLQDFSEPVFAYTPLEEMNPTRKSNIRGVIEEFLVEIKSAHKRTRQVCSAERLQYDLAEHGVQVGIYRIKRIRRKLGIRCKQRYR